MWLRNKTTGVDWEVDGEIEKMLSVNPNFAVVTKLEVNKAWRLRSERTVSSQSSTPPLTSKADSTPTGGPQVTPDNKNKPLKPQPDQSKG